MAATKGRLLALKVGNAASPEVFTAVAGLTSKTVTIANGTLDVTTDDDSGIKTLLPGLYGKGVTISASGVAPDTTAFAALRTAANAGTPKNYQVDNPASTGGATYAGEFIITSFEETGETDGAISFSISLESTGTVTIS